MLLIEQASRFAGELKQKQQRLSNVVMMGMGEPLANYDNGESDFLGVLVDDLVRALYSIASVHPIVTESTHDPLRLLLLLAGCSSGGVSTHQQRARHWRSAHHHFYRGFGASHPPAGPRARAVHASGVASRSQRRHSERHHAHQPPLPHP